MLNSKEKLFTNRQYLNRSQKFTASSITPLFRFIRFIAYYKLLILIGAKDKHSNRIFIYKCNQSTELKSMGCHDSDSLRNNICQ